MKTRIAVIQSHPIQYFSPWYRALAREAELDLKVFYCYQPTQAQQGAGFGVPFEWDIPLLEGYNYEFLPNAAKKPGTHFNGCNTPQLSRLIASRAFDMWLVPGWNYRSYWQAMRACWRYRVPMMVRGDSNLIDPRPWHVRLAKRLILGRWIPRFSAYLTVGRLSEDYYRFYGADESRFFPARHFVDNEWLDGKAETARKQRAEIRRGWGIPENAFCVMFCGKFIPNKRPLDLVAAAQLLLDSNPQLSTLHSPLSNLQSSNPLPPRPRLHLLFVGSGELGPQLRARCSVVFDAEATVNPSARPSDFSISVSQNVSFSAPLLSPNSNLPSSVAARPPASFGGFLNQTQINQAYAACDLLVLPSGYGETWGLVVNEAMACQRPAVVSEKVGCGPDLVQQGETGFVFPAGDLKTLAEIIGRYAGEPALAAVHGQAAYEHVRAHYSIEMAVSGMLRAVRSLRLQE